MIPTCNIRKILFLAILIISTSCNFDSKKGNPVWSDLPEVTSLDNLKETDFVVTLENPISKNKNIIYAPAFLYAWDKVKEELRSPIVADTSNSLDFYFLNKCISHQNSLTKTEYSSTVEIVGDAIIAKAFFNKVLPFETKLQALDEPIHFDTVNVSGFGMYYYDAEVVKISKILYYKDDENFILKLTPKDNQHEILLAKGVDKYKTLHEALNLYDNLIVQGKKELKNASLAWKYQIVPDDIFAIPEIKFNIETQYRNLVGQKFFTKDKKSYSFEIAYQRTGFILNENGAVVESVAEAAADSASTSPVITHPKKMIFDSPFLIIIKRVDELNPYFVMKVTNAELLTKK
jgi:hypothetical protein